MLTEFRNEGHAEIVYPPKTTFCRMYKNMGFFKAKHYIFFVVVVGIGCFSIQWVVVFCENVIL